MNGDEVHVILMANLPSCWTVHLNLSSKLETIVILDLFNTLDIWANSKTNSGLFVLPITLSFTQVQLWVFGNFIICFNSYIYFFFISKEIVLDNLYWSDFISNGFLRIFFTYVFFLDFFFEFLMTKFFPG